MSQIDFYKVKRAQEELWHDMGEGKQEANTMVFPIFFTLHINILFFFIFHVYHTESLMATNFEGSENKGNIHRVEQRTPAVVLCA